jgi:ABC-2 type transport system permease protein
MTRALAKTTWIELKLFAREPLTLVVTLALPVVLLFVLGSVFGNVPDPDVYRGVGPMDFYIPAYIGLVLASLGLVGLPVHLAGYRERGVLRRFRASSVPLWSVFGGLVAVTMIVAGAGSALLVAVAAPAYGINAPESPVGVVGAFLVGGLAFAALGILLGSLLPTARAAQGLGILLWFVMLMIAGAGPPPEVLTEAMRAVADLTPLRHVITLIQDPWLGFGWNVTESLIVLGILAAAAVLSVLRLRRD